MITDPDAPIEEVLSRPKQLVVVASTVADHIMDLMVRLSIRKPTRLPGIVHEAALLEQIWDSYKADRRCFAMALDFDWHRSGTWRLLRTGGAWMGLSKALAADAGASAAFAAYLSARHQSLRPESILSVRAGGAGFSPETGPVARAIDAAGLTAQFKTVDGDWNDRRSIGGYCLLGNHLAETLHGWRPAAGILPTFPIWQSLLDEPGLMLALRAAYREDPIYPPVAIAENGRTFADATGVAMRTPPSINIGGAAINMDDVRPMYRVYLSQGGAWGVFRIRDGSLRNPFLGTLEPYTESR